MQKRVFKGVICLILAFFAFFFLGESYNISIWSQLAISIITMVLLYLYWMKGNDFFWATLLTGLSIFISVEISFNLNYWLVFAIAVASSILSYLIMLKWKNKEKYVSSLIVLYVVVWIILGFNVLYREDWLLENYLTVPFVILILFSYKWFRFSDISYTMIYIFMTLHIIGSHYTYAEVPFGFWMQHFFELGRNHYDRIVHFSFGLLFAYPMREMIKRIGNSKGVWSYYIPVEFVLAFSAIYEIIEWAIAVIYGGDLGIAYLGSQGDVWDAQKDMALAGGGSVITMLVVFLVLLYIDNRKTVFEFKESFKVKQKDVLGEKALKRISRK